MTNILQTAPFNTADSTEITTISGVSAFGNSINMKFNKAGNWVAQDYTDAAAVLDQWNISHATDVITINGVEIGLPIIFWYFDDFPTDTAVEVSSFMNSGIGDYTYFAFGFTSAADNAPNQPDPLVQTVSHINIRARKVGSPVGSLPVEIQQSNGVEPDLMPLLSGSALLSSIGTSFQDVKIPVSGMLTANTEYFFVIDTSGFDATNYVELEGYAAGSALAYDGNLSQWDTYSGAGVTSISITLEYDLWYANFSDDYADHNDGNIHLYNELDTTAMYIQIDYVPQLPSPAPLPTSSMQVDSFYLGPEPSPVADLKLLSVDINSGKMKITTLDPDNLGVGVPYTQKTTTYLAVSGDKILADSSGGVFTITLPAAPSIGDSVLIMDGGDSFAINSVTVNRNSLNIQGAAVDYLLNIDNGWVEFVYNGASRGWEVRT